MADYPPFMNAYNSIGKVLGKIRQARAPDRFTQDFLSTVLGFKSSGARPFVAFAKRIGLLYTDGRPTDLYIKFRNTDDNISGNAMASAIKKGYSELYSKSEYAHKLTDNELEGQFVELTGLEKGNKMLSALKESYKALKKHAKFDVDIKEPEKVLDDGEEIQPPIEINSSKDNMNIGLSYTINIVLPKTDDISIFNAIFKSLRNNLLK